MRNIVRLVMAISVVLAVVAVVRSGEAKDARGVVNRAIQALGGEAKLAKHLAMTWREKGTYYGMGEGLPYTGSYAVQWPSQFRMDVEGVFTICIDGDKGWMKTGEGVKDLTKAEHDLQMHNHRVGLVTLLTPLKDKAFQLVGPEKGKVGNEAVDIVKVTRAGFPEVRLYFSSQTGLLVKSEYRTKAPEQKFQEVNQAIYYGNYQDLDGVKVARKITLKRDDKLFVEAEIVEPRAHGKLDAKAFAKPAQ